MAGGQRTSENGAGGNAVKQTDPQQRIVWDDSKQRLCQYGPCDEHAFYDIKC